MAATIRPGDVIVTRSHGLPCSPRILHAATASGGANVVARAMRDVLNRSEALGLESIAVPALGTGTGGLAVEQCAMVLANEVLAYGSDDHRALRIVFVLHSKPDYDSFVKVFTRMR